jgi:DNA-binding NtrC family response regulator
MRAVEAGAFRCDLYYRLKVVALTLLLCASEWKVYRYWPTISLLASRMCRVRTKPLSAEACACLLDYDWPGNVRELEYAVEHPMVLGVAQSILPEDFPEEIEASPAAPASSSKYQSVISSKRDS